MKAETDSVALERCLRLFHLSQTEAAKIGGIVIELRELTSYSSHEENGEILTGKTKEIEE